MRAPEPYLVWRDPEPADGQATSALSRPEVNRWIRIGLVAALVLIAVPPTPYLLSPLWLLSIATGYGAAVLIGLVMLLPLRRLTSWPTVRISVERHKRLAEAALALTAVHTLLLLVGDTLTIEYLWPSQPRYMLAGNIGLILLAVLVLTSLERVRVGLFGDRLRFRTFHVASAVILTVLVAAHMVGSGIFIAHPVKAALLALFSAGFVAATLKQPIARARAREAAEPLSQASTQ